METLPSLVICVFLTNMVASSPRPSSSVRFRSCTKCQILAPIFGVPGTSKMWAEFLCQKCAQFNKNLLELKRRCWNCTTMAIFGPRGGSYKHARHCRHHKLDNEEDVKHRRCEGEGCERWPCFGSKNDMIRRRCSRHQREEDVYLRNPSNRSWNSTSAFHCAHTGCSKGASWCALSGLRYCAEHRPAESQDFRHRLCANPLGCSRQPSFGSLSDGLRRFCARHARPSDVNLCRRRRRCSSSSRPAAASAVGGGAKM